ncbi:hypothetical protein H310_10191 [Aphanomyces invadans]|uniref:Uncharacterized protein n=1 Tax=Aphanomyces invadans TaxID=157072 RepID=A0A024TT17_9STRA|nr:hypothetical protein H310_10191 [Aphanomyces invadans]ETV96437.1 hypothetical protein H310_10191 [Aphanomyces invadans]|eukprot:XP_008874700.1 hypothetical protein H310_10191 [Aphanomyces invadans]
MSGIYQHCGYSIKGRFDPAKQLSQIHAIIARDPAALITQLELIESFCAFSGFKLNRNKTKLLTSARESTGYPSGAGDASDVALRLRDRQFIDRLELWSHQMRSLVGKQQTALIDRLMLQFLHDESI